MKAIFLVKNGAANTAFEIRETPTPVPGYGEVLIKVEAFGLNFADVMARRGMYKEAPPKPCVLGYDVAGTIAATGEGVQHLQPGNRVTAMTRFGGYAEYAITQAQATAAIPGHMEATLATALATQYCTAYFAAAEMTSLHPGDQVLIQSGAGGVGSALIQYALHKGCTVFSTAGSTEKLALLSAAGVHHPINYRTEDFAQEVKKITGGKGLDVIFDAVGGSSVKKGFRSLKAGGRIVCYGAAAMNGVNIFGKIKAGLGFGFYHPAMLMMPSKSIIGINMLKVADEKPEMISRCLKEVLKLVEADVFKPSIGKVFPATEIAAAHEYLENRQSTGKIAMQW